MDWIHWAVSLLIALGAMLMAFNIVKFREVTTIFRGTAQKEFEALKPVLVFHQALIVCFFVGYLIVLAALNATEMRVGNFFVGLIFFSGALFVLLGIRLQKKMIQSIRSTWEDTLSAHDKLSESNLKLTHEIRQHKATSDRLQRSYDTQTVVNQLLKASLSEASVQDVVEHCLDLIISLPWLSFETQGCIFLVEEDDDTLVMKAHRGFPDDLVRTCGCLSFGKCLCGQAAREGTLVYAGHLDDRHEILLPGTPDHGHYCIPILAKEKTLGVINIHLKPGHQRNEWEEDFLWAVANTMAVILMHRRADAQTREIETRLQQSQKMESIGTLAGGIAHDFNNILSGIYGYTRLAEMHLNDPEKVKTKLDQIHKGAKRASDLIQQILTFSRKSENEKMPVKLRSIVTEAVRFLRSSIPASVQIREEIVSRAVVMANATQIHQIVINLCTNAFHAMKQSGGKLSVRLADAPGDCPIPGACVLLEVRDTGAGMTPEVLSKVFEPYFTTKEVREGTGLGLSVVMGIVRDHGGHIRVDSTPGRGSCFSVYLPMLGDAAVAEGAGALGIPVRGGQEHVLMVDDEKSILNSTAELLRDFGYKVSEAPTPASALDLFYADPGGIDLVVTDYTMPGMTGTALAQRLFEVRPDLPVILCTGYNDAVSQEKALKMGIREYFQKPVEGQVLLASVRRLLDRK